MTYYFSQNTEDKINLYAGYKDELIVFQIVANIRSKTEGITYKKKVFWMEIPISREFKDKCHVNNAM